MKKLFITTIIMLLFVFVYADKKTKDRAIKITKIDGKEVPVLDIMKVKKERAANLSDLFDNLEFIALETNEEHLIDYKEMLTSCEITKNYILYRTYGQGIYQFDRNGRFIRKLVNYGKGPKEVTIGKSCFLGNDMIYMRDYSKKYFLKINLKSGKIKESHYHKMPGHISLHEYINEKYFAIKTSIPFDLSLSHEENYAKFKELTIIDTCGNIIKEFPFNFQYLFTTGPPVHRHSLINTNSHVYHLPKYNDTIKIIQNNNQIPSYIIKNFIQNKKSQCYGDVYSGVNYLDDNYILTTFFKLQKTRRVSSQLLVSNYEETLVLIDKREHRAIKLKPVYNDCFGEEIKHLIGPKFKITNNGYYYRLIDAISFLEFVEKLKSDESIKIKDRDKLYKLAETVTEEDNPIILIGKFKENIEL